MKPTSALLIAIASFVVNPCAGSLAVAQFPKIPAATQATAQSQPQDQAQDNVLAYLGGADRSGNVTVPGLTWQRARSLHLDQAFQARIAGNVYAQPLFWRTLESTSGRLLVATEDNNVYALDATTGHLIWARSLGKPDSRSALRCGSIDPLGVTGTPVIDEATQSVYLDAAIADASGPRHRIFALSLKDGPQCWGGRLTSLTRYGARRSPSIPATRTNAEP
jgi:outer membrane protein assembly factor BamB